MLNTAIELNNEKDFLKVVKTLEKLNEKMMKLTYEACYNKNNYTTSLITDSYKELYDIGETLYLFIPEKRIITKDTVKEYELPIVKYDKSYLKILEFGFKQIIKHVKHNDNEENDLKWGIAQYLTELAWNLDLELMYIKSNNKEK